MVSVLGSGVDGKAKQAKMQPANKLSGTARVDSRDGKKGTRKVGGGSDEGSDRSVFEQRAASLRIGKEIFGFRGAFG